MMMVDREDRLTGDLMMVGLEVEGDMVGGAVEAGDLEAGEEDSVVVVGKERHTLAFRGVQEDHGKIKMYDVSLINAYQQNLILRQSSWSTTPCHKSMMCSIKPNQSLLFLPLLYTSYGRRLSIHIFGCVMQSSETSSFEITKYGSESLLLLLPTELYPADISTVSRLLRKFIVGE